MFLSRRCQVGDFPPGTSSKYQSRVGADPLQKARAITIKDRPAVGLWHTVSHEEYINTGNKGSGLARAGQSEPGYELASKRLCILRNKRSQA